jgi:hypothetical protein
VGVDETSVWSWLDGESMSVESKVMTLTQTKVARHSGVLDASRLMSGVDLTWDALC